MMKLKSKYALVVLLAWLMALPMMGQVEKDVTDDDDETVAAADTLSADSLLADTLATDSLLPWPQSVRARIDRLVQADLLRTSQLGLMVYDLDADSAIYCFNERQTMRPASTMKVITAITALDKLGGSHQFKTELCYTGTIENRTLTGNVYCVGGMDPRFNTDDMHAFIESLQKMGVDTIRGTLYADKSMKTTDLLGKGWCWDDDNPVLSALVYGPFYARTAQGRHRARRLHRHWSTPARRHLHLYALSHNGPSADAYDERERQPLCRGHVLPDCRRNGKQTSHGQKRGTSGEKAHCQARP